MLEYKGGSPCPDPSDLHRRDSPVHEGAAYKNRFYTDEDEDEYRTTSKVGTALAATAAETVKRRKTAAFTFFCHHDPMDTVPLLSFINTPDECAYFFKVRSQHACAGAEPQTPGSVGPGGVFAIIFSVALLVYFLGGVFYQRTVAHARGWRQMPNYSFWAGIWSFIKVSHSQPPSFVRSVSDHR